VGSEPISSSPIYNVTFLEFDENDSLNQKNNNSVNSSSINSPSMLFSSVSSHYGLEQYLNPANVFSSLLSLSFSLFYSPIVDSTNNDTDFKKLILHFTYRSPFLSSPSFSFSKQHIDSSTSQEEFKVFLELSLHVFSSFSSHYYSLC
jgi:hypothetical protein